MNTRTTPPVGPWRKSSYSSPNGECVECASTAWHTASYSSGVNNNCVEVAEGPVTGVRDSKNPDHGALFFGTAEWGAFLASVRGGEL